MSEISKNYVAGGAITKYRLAKFGAADRAAVQASAATDALIGVNAELDVVQGERVDIVRSGFAPVQYGGNVTRGDPLTSDANGKAIKANPAAGTRMSIAGYAEVSAVDGDIELMLVAPGFITTPAA
ncbi:capsid cement protein [Solimonas sp. SE-A11]|uniref:capsid cement protein n=1 Tax=Solimonas sp. SE-A11 TaxID=3054954 RepID=UPI00259CAEB5|nr:capsid cement protein [Solimonas sp. SE-A11]MDM4768661.1 DUF2190 family protein [Solimonas sp. SE-A11]